LGAVISSSTCASGGEPSPDQFFGQRVQSGQRDRVPDLLGKQLSIAPAMRAGARRSA
jgi:hypothetical protein